MNIEHGAPVNKVFLFQNDSICVSAGGLTVKLWDITAGGKLLYTFENHNRNVYFFKTLSKFYFIIGRIRFCPEFALDNILLIQDLNCDQKILKKS